MGPERVARVVLSNPSRAKTSLLMILSISILAARAQAQADPKAAAREHFAKGVAAFDDRRFAEAAEEFEEAYRLSPAFVVLYNIGQVDVVLGRSVDAVDAFDKYLKEGASAVPPERRREVEGEIEKQAARIGTIAVRTFPDGAELRVDGRRIGITPLARPVRVTAGRHNVAATLAGRATQVRDVDVGGRAEIALELTLEPALADSAAAAPAAPPAPAQAAQPIAPVAAAAPPPEPAAPQPVVEMPVVEKTVIERTFVETPTIEKRPSETPRVQASSISVQRILGYVIVAGGLATATVGGVLAFRGANQSDDARQRLLSASSDADWNSALADFNAGKSRNQEGWIVAGIGGAVLIGGIVLLATVPERSNSISFAPWITTGSRGLAMNAAW